MHQTVWVTAHILSENEWCTTCLRSTAGVYTLHFDGIPTTITKECPCELEPDQ